jgi:hypothetical protein
VARVADCLERGMEASLTPIGAGVICAMPARGGHYLNELELRREARPHLSGEPAYLPLKLKVQDICATAKTKTPDPRIVPRNFVNRLYSEARDRISPKGIRIIGGVY